MKDHKNYWQWHKNRNESRWQQQEVGELDYDAKNMMHTFRLLYSGKNILDHGEPLVRFNGELKDFLMKIRQGEYDYDDLNTRADSLVEEMEESFKQSTLPEEADTKAIDQLTKRIYQQWYERTQS